LAVIGEEVERRIAFFVGRCSFDLVKPLTGSTISNDSEQKKIPDENYG
jgi:hypothetical protein